MTVADGRQCVDARARPVERVVGRKREKRMSTECPRSSRRRARSTTVGGSTLVCTLPIGLPTSCRHAYCHLARPLHAVVAKAEAGVTSAAICG